VRVTLYTPPRIDYESLKEATENMLVMVGVTVSPDVIDQWTKYELLLAYDWAARDYLRASDNVTIRPRPCPSFVKGLNPA
jgi:hypothetical protein